MKFSEALWFLPYFAWAGPCRNTLFVPCFWMFENSSINRGIFPAWIASYSQGMRRICLTSLKLHSVCFMYNKNLLLLSYCWRASRATDVLPRLMYALFLFPLRGTWLLSDLYPLSKRTRLCVLACGNALRTSFQMRAAASAPPKASRVRRSAWIKVSSVVCPLTSSLSFQSVNLYGREWIAQAACCDFRGSLVSTSPGMPHQRAALYHMLQLA